jgi:hypothetical protein
MPNQVAVFCASKLLVYRLPVYRDQTAAMDISDVHACLESSEVEKKKLLS